MNSNKFDRNRPFNELALLPPEYNISDNVNILKQLVKSSRALAKVDGKLNQLPNPFMLVNTIALQEAKASAAIENIFTTEDELYKAISEKKKEENASPNVKEVLKYREALWAGLKDLKQNKLINSQLIKSVFQQIKGSAEGFRPPQSQVVIKRGNSEIKAGEIIYTPPRGEIIIEDLIDNLIEYLIDDEKYPLDPLLKMCVGHYQFEAIHPFRDGNGRTGRILNLLYLIDKALLTNPVIYISKYIIENKDEYYYKLSAVTQRSDWESWIIFMLKAVEITSLSLNNKIDEIINQMESTLNYAKQRIKWYNKEVNEAIFNQPYIKAKLIGEILGKTSRTTLTKYMNELIDSKILRAQKDGVEVYYINDDLIRILES